MNPNGRKAIFAKREDIGEHELRMLPSSRLAGLDDDLLAHELAWAQHQHRRATRDLTRNQISEDGYYYRLSERERWGEYISMVVAEAERRKLRHSGPSSPATPPAARPPAAKPASRQATQTPKTRVEKPPTDFKGAPRRQSERDDEPEGPPIHVYDRKTGTLRAWRPGDPV
jgi:hypothetical protein